MALPTTIWQASEYLPTHLRIARFAPLRGRQLRPDHLQHWLVEHLQAPLTIFGEMSRVLAPGGILKPHTPNTRNYLVFANILAKKLLPRSVILKLVHDGRATDDIYPTYYQANNAPTLHSLGESVHLQSESVHFLTQPQPYTRFFAPAAFFEMLLMRATMTRPLNRFAATIVMTFRKASVPISENSPAETATRAAFKPKSPHTF